MDRPYSVLFISRRNSARSLMAEAVVNRRGQARFRAFSAAVGPPNDPDPLAIEVLEQAGYPTKTLRPNRWRKFTGPDAPVFDFVVTLSDTTSREAFPDWPGRPVAAHWRYAGPTKENGEAWQRQREFVRTLSSIERQMRIFMQLPTLDHIALHKRLDDIGAEQDSLKVAESGFGSTETSPTHLVRMSSTQWLVPTLNSP